MATSKISQAMRDVDFGRKGGVVYLPAKVYIGQPNYCI